jgi:hypothetical protein
MKIRSALLVRDYLDGDGVHEALRARRVYATSGPRIILRAALSGRRMGSIVTEPSRIEELKLLVITPAPVERIDIVRSGEIAETISGENQRDLFLHREIRDLQEGEYLYVRVVQADGGLAWSSPFFVGSAGS